MNNKEDSKITNDEMDLLMSNNNYDDEHNKAEKKDIKNEENTSSNQEINQSEAKKEDLKQDSNEDKEESNEDQNNEEDSDEKKDDKKDDSNKDKKEKKKSSKPLLFLVLILIGVIIFFLVDHKLNSKSNISKNDKDLIVDYNKTNEEDKDLADDNKIKIDDNNSENNDDLGNLENENDLGLENNDENSASSDTQDFINIDTNDDLTLDNKDKSINKANSNEEKNTENQGIEYRYYKLKPNETLFSLSMWYYNKKSKIQEIKRLNNITDVNSISTRKNLKLMPYKNSKMSSYAPKYYKIKKGETLFSLSMRFYSEKRMIEAIKKLNNISNEKVNDISTGTTLIMP